MLFALKYNEGSQDPEYDRGDPIPTGMKYMSTFCERDISKARLYSAEEASRRIRALNSLNPHVYNAVTLVPVREVKTASAPVYSPATKSEYYNSGFTDNPRWQRSSASGPSASGPVFDGYLEAAFEDDETFAVFPVVMRAVPPTRTVVIIE